MQIFVDTVVNSKKMLDLLLLSSVDSVNDYCCTTTQNDTQATTYKNASSPVSDDESPSMDLMLT